MIFLPIIFYSLILMREVGRTTRTYVETKYINKIDIIAIVLMIFAIGIDLYYIIESYI